MPDPYILGALAGLLKGYGKRKGEQRERQSKLEQLREEARLKAEFDPEVQAKRQALELISSMLKTPRPMGGYNPMEREAGIPGQVEQRAGRNRLQALQEFGLLPRPSGATGVNVYAFDPATGTVQPATGGQALPPKSRVISTRAGEEEKERGAAAGARGRLTVKYEDLVKQLNFI